MRAATAHTAPEQVASAFAEALIDGDPEAAAAHFRSGGVLLTPDGTEVSGRAAIRVLLRQITSSRVDLEIRPTTATLVLVEEQGRWAIAIATPWG
jgi:ketosteroid isomerase-like protein